MSIANNKLILPGEQSLDELLDAVRNDAGYLEGERARQAILNDVMDRAIQSQSVRRFTPIKIGITIMTTLTAGALGLIALGVFAPAPKQKIVHTTQHVAVQPSATQPLALPTQSSVSNVVSRNHTAKIAARTYNHDTAWLTPVKMEAVKPVLLTAEQATQLGIILGKNGEIVYHVTDPMGKVMCTQTYQANGHVIISTDPDSTLAGSPATARMITSIKGEKRFFQFEGTTFPMTSTLRGLGLSDSALKGSYQTMTVINSDTVSIPENAMHTHSLTFSTEDSVAAKAFMHEMGIDPEKTKNVNLNVHIQANRIQDSGSASDSIAALKLMSSMGLSDQEVKDVLSGKIDNKALSKLVSEKMGQMLASKDPSALKDLVKGAVKGALIDVAQNQPDVNKLIPVLVENPDIIGTRNALVFWFEPSAELQAVLGNQYILPATATVQSSSHGALQHVAIAPNPATGSTTLSYTLSDARAISVAVYDITGQKILDVAEATSQPAGMSEIKLDLSKLHAGVYVVAVTTDKGEELTQRIVVEN